MKREDKADLFAHAWKLLAPADAPQPYREYKFWGNKKQGGRARPWKFDFAWRPFNPWGWSYWGHSLVVEIDGGQWQAHGGRHNTDPDRVKMNEAAVAGWRVVRFSTQMLEADPKACVDTVLRALGIDAYDARRDKTWQGDDGPEM